jgi:aminoglycoside/choline kinase family phosphotransferase
MPFMFELPIPSRADDVDAAWITQAVRSGGDFVSASVTALEAHPLEGVHGGLMGDLSRLTLTWDSDDASLPRSVVLKLPTQLEDNRAFAMAFGQYAAEHGFYTHLAPHTDIRVPRCWYGASDQAGEKFVLLLEDVGHLATVDPVDGLSVARAEIAVDEMTRLHTKWWGDESLLATDWLPQSDPDSMRAYGTMVAASLPAFVDATSDLLSEQDHDLCRRFVSQYDTLIPRAAGVPHPLQGPLTLVHRDFHLGNMFFDGDRPTVYDWGNVAMGMGFYDLTYFLAGALTEETCRAHGPDLLDRYRDGLADGGVEMSDFEFSNWHNINALFCLLVPLLAGGDGLASNEQTDLILRATMSRLFAYLRDHEVESVFDLV